MTLGDGAGEIFDALITHIDAKEVTLDVTASRRVERPKPHVSVLQGLSRSGKVDWVVAKLVEIGVDEVSIFSAERSVARWDDSRKAKALARWESIALEAAKQSHRAWLPTVRGPLTVDEAAASGSLAELYLVAHPGAERGLREALVETPGSAVIVIGPEGGLSPSEIAKFEKAGASAVDLGGQILRTETAALVVVSAMFFRFERLG